MQQHQRFADRRRTALTITNRKTKHDDFYTKLERIRLSAAASSSKQCPRRTATELLDESRIFFVKSEEVLHKRQTPANNLRLKPAFRKAQSQRSPYHEYKVEHEQRQSDLAYRSSMSSTTNTSDCAFESVSVLSLSDQTTLDSLNSRPQVKSNKTPSSMSVIERNARIIKWLFQLHKANELPSFQCT